MRQFFNLFIIILIICTIQLSQAGQDPNIVELLVRPFKPFTDCVIGTELETYSQNDKISSQFSGIEFDRTMATIRQMNEGQEEYSLILKCMSIQQVESYMKKIPQKSEKQQNQTVLAIGGFKTRNHIDNQFQRSESTLKQSLVLVQPQDTLGFSVEVMITLILVILISYFLVQISEGQGILEGDILSIKWSQLNNKSSKVLQAIYYTSFLLFVFSIAVNGILTALGKNQEIQVESQKIGILSEYKNLIQSISKLKTGDYLWKKYTQDTQKNIQVLFKDLYENKITAIAADDAIIEYFTYDQNCQDNFKIQEIQEYFNVATFFPQEQDRQITEDFNNAYQMLKQQTNFKKQIKLLQQDSVCKINNIRSQYITNHDLLPLWVALFVTFLGSVVLILKDMNNSQNSTNNKQNTLNSQQKLSETPNKNQSSYQKPYQTQQESQNNQINYRGNNNNNNVHYSREDQQQQEKTFGYKGNNYDPEKAAKMRRKPKELNINDSHLNKVNISPLRKGAKKLNNNDQQAHDSKNYNGGNYQKSLNLQKIPYGMEQYSSNNTNNNHNQHSYEEEKKIDNNNVIINSNKNYISQSQQQQNNNNNFMEGQGEEEESKVLLVAIYNKDKANVNFKEVQSLFEQFGDIRRMMQIKGKNSNSIIWKFFVEMDQMQNARVAKHELHNATFLETANLHVFYSELKQISLNTNNKKTGGLQADFSEELDLKQRQKNKGAKVQQNTKQQVPYTKHDTITVSTIRTYLNKTMHSNVQIPKELLEYNQRKLINKNQLNIYSQQENKQGQHNNTNNNDYQQQTPLITPMKKSNYSTSNLAKNGNNQFNQQDTAFSRQQESEECINKRIELENSQNKWIKSMQEEQGEDLKRKKAIQYQLNILAPDNFDQIKQNLLNFTLKGEQTSQKQYKEEIDQMIGSIVKKAMSEFKYVKTYAQLCKYLIANCGGSRNDKDSFKNLLNQQIVSVISDDNNNLIFNNSKKFDNEQDFVNERKKKLIQIVIFLTELYVSQVFGFQLIQQVYDLLLTKFYTGFFKKEKISPEIYIEVLISLFERAGAQCESPIKAKKKNELQILDNFFQSMQKGKINNKIILKDISADGIFSIFDFLKESQIVDIRVRALIQNLVERKDSGWEVRSMVTDLTAQTLSQIKTSHIQEQNSKMNSRKSSVNQQFVRSTPNANGGKINHNSGHNHPIYSFQSMEIKSQDQIDKELSILYNDLVNDKKNYSQLIDQIQTLYEESEDKLIFLKCLIQQSFSGNVAVLNKKFNFCLEFLRENQTSSYFQGCLKECIESILQNDYNLKDDCPKMGEYMGQYLFKLRKIVKIDEIIIESTGDEDEDEEIKDFIDSIIQVLNNLVKNLQGEKDLKQFKEEIVFFEKNNILIQL